MAEWPVDFVTRPAWRGGWGVLMLKMVNNKLVIEREFDRVLREYA